MWGRGFQQRSVEELAKAEAEAQSGRAPDNGPRKRGNGALGALGLAFVVVLGVLFMECSSESEAEAQTPSSSPDGSTARLVEVSEVGLTVEVADV